MSVVFLRCTLVVIAFSAVSSERNVHVAEAGTVSSLENLSKVNSSRLVNATPVSKILKLVSGRNYRKLIRKARSVRNEDSLFKIRVKKRARRLEPKDIACLKWKATPNVTCLPEVRSLVVDYCLHKDLPIPKAKMCLKAKKKIVCVTVRKPNCSCIFENITAGNFTLQIEASCDKCYEKIIHNRLCLNIAYEGSVVLEEPARIGRTLSSTPEDVTIIIAIAGYCAAFFVIFSTTSFAIMWKKKWLPFCLNYAKCCQELPDSHTQPQPSHANSSCCGGGLSESQTQPQPSHANSSCCGGELAELQTQPQPSHVSCSFCGGELPELRTQLQSSHANCSFCGGELVESQTQLQSSHANCSFCGGELVESQTQLQSSHANCSFCGGELVESQIQLQSSHAEEPSETVKLLSYHQRKEQNCARKNSSLAAQATPVSYTKSKSDKTGAAADDPKYCRDCQYKVVAYLRTHRGVLQGPSSPGFNIPSNALISIPYHLIQRKNSSVSNKIASHSEGSGFKPDFNVLESVQV